MFQLLYDPVAEIKKSKKQSYAKILLYLLAAALFETAGLFFFAWRYFSGLLTPDVIAYGVLGVLFVLILAHLVVAFFFAMSMHVLDGKGGYYEALASLVLAMVAPAVAIFFAGAVSFVPYGSGAVGVMLAYGYILGAATLFRSGKEFFELDYAGVLVGFLITAIPLGLISSLVMVLR
ncbi:MAG: hypothetical protein QW165_03115 [Candidatus Woesearchaeota archaeon]